MSEKKYLSKKFSAMNVYLLITGVLLVAIGYLLLKVYSVPYDNFVAMNIAPIFMASGFLVFIPAALLYKKKVN